MHAYMCVQSHILGSESGIERMWGSGFCEQDWFRLRDGSSKGKILLEVRGFRQSCARQRVRFENELVSERSVLCCCVLCAPQHVCCGVMQR